MTSKAQELAKKPDKTVRDAQKAVQEGSASSESLSVIELAHDDGSVLIVSSLQGQEPVLETRFDDVHLLQTPVQVPRVDDAAPPQGLGDDGVLRDENGEPVEVDA